MASFQRAVTSTASGVEVLFVLGAMASGAFAAAIVPAMLATFYGQGYGAAILAAFVGAAVGFVTSSVLVSISMNIRETALNTRRLVELMNPTTLADVNEIEFAAPEPTKKNQPDPRFTKFKDAAKELSADATAALRKAKENGYSLSLTDAGTLVLQRGNEGAFYLVSNGDIEELGKEKGWI